MGKIWKWKLDENRADLAVSYGGTRFQVGYIRWARVIDYVSISHEPHELPAPLKSNWSLSPCANEDLFISNGSVNIRFDFILEGQYCVATAWTTQQEPDPR